MNRTAAITIKVSTEMIEVICREESYRMNIYHLVRAFWPNEVVSSRLDPAIESALKIIDGGTGEVLAQEDDAVDKLKLERNVYDQLKTLAGRDLPWGILTGVRPVKLAMNHIRSLEDAGKLSDGPALQSLSGEEYVSHIMKERLVSRKKAGLSWNVACKESRIIRRLLGSNRNCRTFSLYVGIPVCPSICSYCSFSSGLLSTWATRMDDYVDALCRELAETSKIISGMAQQIGNGVNGAGASAEPDRKFSGILPHPTSVYIGGGTPTVLTAAQLERLLICIRSNYDLDSLPVEFTLEAGRADTITEDKLRVAKSLGVTRLSINPQTMQQKTLDLVGRRHTVGDVVDAFSLARDMGFANINMDLIAGLPGEDARDMADTLVQIEKLAPESLTVHSLAIKRAARLNNERRAILNSEKSAANENREESTAIPKEASGTDRTQNAAQSPAEEMISMAALSAERMGMEPYYLYRQKSIAGNLENTGYARPGYECIYNIMIMEEVQSIIACGAGASSKILLEEAVPDPSRGGHAMTNILHHTNAKDIADYISRVDEMIRQKMELTGGRF